MSNGFFNFKFLALVLSEILGGSQIYTRGPTPLDAPCRDFFCIESVYFTISNCIFNFNYLALVFFEILGGPKFRLGGPVPPTPASGKIFVPDVSTLP